MAETKACAAAKQRGVLPCCRVTVEQQEPGDRGQTSRHTQGRYTAPGPARRIRSHTRTHTLIGQRHTTLGARPRWKGGRLHSCVCDNRASSTVAILPLHTSTAASSDPIRSRIARLCVSPVRGHGDGWSLCFTVATVSRCWNGQKLDELDELIMPGTGSRNAAMGGDVGGRVRPGTTDLAGMQLLPASTQRGQCLSRSLHDPTNEAGQKARKRTQIPRSPLQQQNRNVPTTGTHQTVTSHLQSRAREKMLGQVSAPRTKGAPSRTASRAAVDPSARAPETRDETPGAQGNGAGTTGTNAWTPRVVQGELVLGWGMFVSRRLFAQRRHS